MNFLSNEQPLPKGQGIMSLRGATASVTLAPILTFNERPRRKWTGYPIKDLSLKCRGEGQPQFSSPRGGARWFSAGLLFIALHLVGLPGFAQDSKAETQSPISVEVEVTPMQATVGDLITYSIRIRHDANIKLSTPKFVPPEGLEAVDQGTRELPRKNSQTQQEFWFRMRADLVGTYDIPALSIPFVVSNVDSEAKKVPGQAVSPKAQVEIQSILHLQGEPTDIRDIKPLKNINRDWLPIAFVALAAVLAIALGIFLYLKRKKRTLTESSSKQENLSPHEAALRELELLQNKGLLEKGLIREYYFQLSEIFRRYLGTQFNFPALDWTTVEITNFLSRSSSLDTGISEEICIILEHTDLVKYAKAQVARDENILQKIINLIKETSKPEEPALNNPTTGS